MISRYLLLIITILSLFSGCKKEEDTVNNDPPIELNNGFQLVLGFFPSFDTAFFLKMDMFDSVKTVSIIPVVLEGYYESSFPTSTYNISENDFKEFIGKINNLPIPSMNSDNAMIVDGIFVSVFFKNGEISRSFGFHSPNNRSDYFMLASSVLNLALSTIKQEPYMNNIENAIRYFSYHQGFHILCKDPYYIRFFGHLRDNFSSDYDLLFKSIANNEDIIFDIRNVSGLDQKINTSLSEFSKSKNKLLWISDRPAELCAWDSINSIYKMITQQDYLNSIISKNDKIFDQPEKAYKAIYLNYKKYPYFYPDHLHSRAGTPIPVPGY